MCRATQTLAFLDICSNSVFPEGKCSDNRVGFGGRGAGVGGNNYNRVMELVDHSPTVTSALLCRRE